MNRIIYNLQVSCCRHTNYDFRSFIQRPVNTVTWQNLYMEASRAPCRSIARPNITRTFNIQCRRGGRCVRAQLAQPAQHLKTNNFIGRWKAPRSPPLPIPHSIGSANNQDIDIYLQCTYLTGWQTIARTSATFRRRSRWRIVHMAGWSRRCEMVDAVRSQALVATVPPTLNAEFSPQKREHWAIHDVSK